MAKRVFQKRQESSVLDRTKIKNYYLLKYYNLFMNAYKFTGLDYQQKDFLLRKLWSVGTLASFKLDVKTDESPEGLLVLCPYASMKLNIYSFPTEVNLIALRPVNFIPKTPQVVDKDVVLVWGQRNKRPILELVDHLVEKITDVEMTLRTNLKANKTPWIIGYTPESANQREMMRTALDQDEPYLFMETQDVNQYKALLSGVNYNCDKLYALKQCYENELREYLGIDNLGVNEKKEHLITAEIDSNNEAIQSSGECFLDCLKEWCERVKEVLGYTISVELNKPDEIEYNESGEEEEQKDEI